MRDPSYWETQAVADILAAALPELNLPGAAFQVEVLGNQVDFEKDQMNRAAPHLLVSWVMADHDHGYPGADPVTLAFVAVVPNASQVGRRNLAINACLAIANWMREGSTNLQ